MQLVKFTLPLAILAVLVSSAPVPSSNVSKASLLPFRVTSSASDTHFLLCFSLGSRLAIQCPCETWDGWSRLQLASKFSLSLAFCSAFICLYLLNSKLSWLSKCLQSKQAEKRRKDFAQVSPLDPVAAAFTGIRPGTLVRPGSGNAWKNGIKNSVKAVGNAVRKIFRGWHVGARDLGGRLKMSSSQLRWIFFQHVLCLFLFVSCI